MSADRTTSVGDNTYTHLGQGDPTPGVVIFRKERGRFDRFGAAASECRRSMAKRFVGASPPHPYRGPSVVDEWRAALADDRGDPRNVDRIDVGVGV